MLIHSHWSYAAAATAVLFLGASPANAAPAPEPTGQTAQTMSARTCARIDALAQSLRASGFSAQAAQNYAILIQRDCLDEV